jgi:hypothetical protein
MSARALKSGAMKSTLHEKLPIECGGTVVFFRIAEGEEPENFPAFVLKLTQAANSISRVIRFASNGPSEVGGEDMAHALAGIECLTELAAGISERLRDELHDVDFSAKRTSEVQS